jgi:hypothetical protein
MTKPSVRRIFDVEAPLEKAWHRLAEVERWPGWAPHIVSVSVSPKASSVRHRAASSGSSGWGGTLSACRHGSRRSGGSGSAGFLGFASTTTTGSRHPVPRPPAGVGGRAPSTPRAAHPARLRPRVRSQRRSSHSAPAGVVPPAGEKRSADRSISRRQGDSAGSFEKLSVTTLGSSHLRSTETQLPFGSSRVK